MKRFLTKKVNQLLMSSNTFGSQINFFK